MFLHTCPIFFYTYIKLNGKNYIHHPRQSKTWSWGSKWPDSDGDWFNKIPEKEDGEEDMLDMAFEPKTNSRLSCQIVVSDEIDGLEVNIPSKQA